MKNKIITIIIALLTLIISVNAATLTCQQVSDASISAAQFASKTLEIRCSASGGTVSNIQITPNSNPSVGVSITSSKTISSSLSDQESDTAKWTIIGETPNTYTISYQVSSVGTEAWSGADTTEVTINSPAQLNVEYVSPPSTYSSSEDLNIKIFNIGGTTANNVKVQLNSGSKIDYPTTIPAGSSASYSWTSSTGYSAAGTYVTKVYIDATLQDSASATVSSSGGDTVDDGGGDTGGSSGGGGGGSSSPSTTTTIAEPVTTIEEIQTQPESEVEKIVLDSTEGTTELINLKENDQTKILLENTNFRDIVIISTINRDDIEFTIKKDTYEIDGNTITTSSGTTFEINEEDFGIYDIITIENNIMPQELESITISFKVSKDWLNENGYDKDSIILLRAENGGATQEITPQFDFDDSNYIYYKTTASNAFSTYSIIGLGEKEQPIAIQTQETPTEEIQQVTTPQKKDYTIFIYGGAIITILIIIAFLIEKRRNQ